MIDYNNGKWHPWDMRDECPIHPESEMDFVWHNESSNEAHVVKSRKARGVMWSKVLRFRVAEAYREPREWWVKPENGVLYILGSAYVSDELAREAGYTLVREVLE